jgi:putative ubiquitin-RnfH superfamily antitoxin RatB of RatAB toxin-antitoxin module
MAVIEVEVAYALPNRQEIIVVAMEAGSSMLAAIERSCILQIFPEIDLSRQKIGVFSQPRLLTDIVCAGDRIEIYRPLAMDPKEARRLRVRKKAGANKKK